VEGFGFVFFGLGYGDLVGLLKFLKQTGSQSGFEFILES